MVWNGKRGHARGESLSVLKTGIILYLIIIVLLLFEQQVDNVEEGVHGEDQDRCCWSR